MPQTHRTRLDRPDPQDRQPTTLAIAHALEDIALALMAALDGGRQDEADTIAGSLGPDAIRTAMYVASERVALDHNPVPLSRVLVIAGVIVGKRAQSGTIHAAGDSARPFALLGQGDYRRELTAAGWRAAPEVRP